MMAIKKVLILTMLSMPVILFGDGFIDDKVAYSLEYNSNDRAYVTGLKDLSATSIVIPKTVRYEYQEYDSEEDKYKTRHRTCIVTRIQDYAFEGCENLHDVQIEEGITEIGRGAFSRSGITNFVMPDSVTKLGEWSMGNCEYLEYVKLSDNLTEIGSHVLYSCSNLTSVVIGSKVESLGWQALEANPKLKNVILPETLVFADNAALSRTAIEVLVIPNSLTNMGSGAFSYNSQLRTLYIGSGLREIEAGHIKYNRELQNLAIGVGVTNILTGGFHCSTNIVFCSFAGLPPKASASSFWHYKNGRYRINEGAVGTYPVEYASDWKAVIDASGHWCGFKMQESKESYTVAYDANGGRGIPMIDKVITKEQFSALDKNTYKKDKSVFKGWAISLSNANEGKVEYKDGQEIWGGGDITLYAVWSQTSLTLSPIDADWRTGSITLKCEDADTSSTTHTYSLAYYNETDDAWVLADGNSAQDVQLGSDGYAHLSDTKFASRNNGVGTVKYRGMDETGRISECITRNRHGLFVGVDEYQDNWCSLENHFDHYLSASTFAGTYTRYGGKDGYVKVLHGSETKRATILAQLNYISENITAPGDILVFYYEGHGKEHLITCWDKYIYGENHGIIYASELAEYFKSVPAGTAVVAILASCHSGGLIDKQYDWDRDGNIGWIVAAQSDQNAYCGQLNSVLCNDGWLKGKADIVGSNVEADGNGYVTFAELALWGQEWMGDRKNYESESNIYPYGQLLSFYNSNVLRNIVAGNIPKGNAEDRKWNWLKGFKKAWTKTIGDISSATTTLSANGVRTIDECYLLGLDPDDPDDDFKITHFEMVNGEPVFELNHTTDGSGESFLPRIKKLGKVNIKDDWSEVPPGGNPAYRFFTVKVETP